MMESRQLTSATTECLPMDVAQNISSSQYDLTGGHSDLSALASLNLNGFEPMEVEDFEDEEEMDAEKQEVEKELHVARFKAMSLDVKAHEANNLDPDKTNLYLITVEILTLPYAQMKHVLEQINPERLQMLLNSLSEYEKEQVLKILFSEQPAENKAETSDFRLHRLFRRNKPKKQKKIRNPLRLNRNPNRALSDNEEEDLEKIPHDLIERVDNAPFIDEVRKLMYAYGGSTHPSKYGALVITDHIKEYVQSFLTCNKKWKLGQLERIFPGLYKCYERSSKCRTFADATIDETVAEPAESELATTDANRAEKVRKVAEYDIDALPDVVYQIQVKKYKGYVGWSTRIDQQDARTKEMLNAEYFGFKSCRDQSILGQKNNRRSTFLKWLGVRDSTNLEPQASKFLNFLMCERISCVVQLAALRRTHTKEAPLEESAGECFEFEEAIKLLTELLPYPTEDYVRKVLDKWDEDNRTRKKRSKSYAPSRRKSRKSTGGTKGSRSKSTPRVGGRKPRGKSMPRIPKIPKKIPPRATGPVLRPRPKKVIKGATLPKPTLTLPTLPALEAGISRPNRSIPQLPELMKVDMPHATLPITETEPMRIEKANELGLQSAKLQEDLKAVLEVKSESQVEAVVQRMGELEIVDKPEHEEVPVALNSVVNPEVESLETNSAVKTIADDVEETGKAEAIESEEVVAAKESAPPGNVEKEPMVAKEIGENNDVVERVEEKDTTKMEEQNAASEEVDQASPKKDVLPEVEEKLEIGKEVLDKRVVSEVQTGEIEKGDKVQAEEISSETAPVEEKEKMPTKVMAERALPDKDEEVPEKIAVPIEKVKETQVEEKPKEVQKGNDTPVRRQDQPEKDEESAKPVENSPMQKEIEEKPKEVEKKKEDIPAKKALPAIEMEAPVPMKAKVDTMEVEEKKGKDASSNKEDLAQKAEEIPAEIAAEPVEKKVLPEVDDMQVEEKREVQDGPAKKEALVEKDPTGKDQDAPEKMELDSGVEKDQLPVPKKKPKQVDEGKEAPATKPTVREKKVSAKKAQEKKPVKGKKAPAKKRASKKAPAKKKVEKKPEKPKRAAKKASTKKKSGGKRSKSVKKTSAKKKVAKDKPGASSKKKADKSNAKPNAANNEIREKLKGMKIQELRAEARKHGLKPKGVSRDPIISAILEAIETKSCTCLMGHEMKFIGALPSRPNGEMYASANCNSCKRKKINESGKFYHCQQCEFDICPDCHSKPEKAMKEKAIRNLTALKIKEYIKSKGQKAKGVKKADLIMQAIQLLESGGTDPVIVQKRVSKFSKVYWTKTKWRGQMKPVGQKQLFTRSVATEIEAAILLNIKCKEHGIDLPNPSVGCDLGKLSDDASPKESLKKSPLKTPPNQLEMEKPKKRSKRKRASKPKPKAKPTVKPKTRRRGPTYAALSNPDMLLRKGKGKSSRKAKSSQVQPKENVSEPVDKQSSSELEDKVPEVKADGPESLEVVSSKANEVEEAAELMDVEDSEPKMPLENEDRSIPASNEQSEAIAPEDALKEVEKASEIAESLEQIEAKDQKSALEKKVLDEEKTELQDKPMEKVISPKEVEESVLNAEVSGAIASIENSDLQKSEMIESSNKDEKDKAQLESEINAQAQINLERKAIEGKKENQKSGNEAPENLLPPSDLSTVGLSDAEDEEIETEVDAASARSTSPDLIATQRSPPSKPSGLPEARPNIPPPEFSKEIPDGKEVDAEKLEAPAEKADPPKKAEKPKKSKKATAASKKKPTQRKQGEKRKRGTSQSGPKKRRKTKKASKTKPSASRGRPRKRSGPKKGKAKAGQKSKSKPRAKSKSKPRAKSKSKPRAKSKSKPRAKSKSKPRAKSKSKPRAKSKSKPRAKSKSRGRGRSKAPAKRKAKESIEDEPYASPIEENVEKAVRGQSEFRQRSKRARDVNTNIRYPLRRNTKPRFDLFATDRMFEDLVCLQENYDQGRVKLQPIPKKPKKARKPRKSAPRGKSKGKSRKPSKPRAKRAKKSETGSKQVVDQNVGEDAEKEEAAEKPKEEKIAEKVNEETAGKGNEQEVAEKVEEDIVQKEAEQVIEKDKEETAPEKEEKEIVTEKVEVLEKEVPAIEAREEPPPPEIKEAPEVSDASNVEVEEDPHAFSSEDDDEPVGGLPDIVESDDEEEEPIGSEGRSVSRAPSDWNEHYGDEVEEDDEDESEGLPGSEGRSVSRMPPKRQTNPRSISRLPERREGVTTRRRSASRAPEVGKKRANSGEGAPRKKARVMGDSASIVEEEVPRKRILVQPPKSPSPSSKRKLSSAMSSPPLKRRKVSGWYDIKITVPKQLMKHWNLIVPFVDAMMKPRRNSEELKKTKQIIFHDQRHTREDLKFVQIELEEFLEEAVNAKKTCNIERTLSRHALEELDEKLEFIEYQINENASCRWLIRGNIEEDYKKQFDGLDFGEIRQKVKRALDGETKDVYNFFEDIRKVFFRQFHFVASGKPEYDDALEIWEDFVEFMDEKRFQVKFPDGSYSIFACDGFAQFDESKKIIWDLLLEPKLAILDGTRLMEEVEGFVEGAEEHGLQEGDTLSLIWKKIREEKFPALPEIAYVIERQLSHSMDFVWTKVWFGQTDEDLDRRKRFAKKLFGTSFRSLSRCAV